MKTNKITLNELQLNNIIKESILKVLNEDVDELNYDTYRNALKKMYFSDQKQRATEFGKTFDDTYSDDDAEYDLKRNTINVIKDPENNYGQDVLIYNDDDKWDLNDMDRKHMARTTARRAKNVARHINFFKGKEYNKNDFRA